MNETVLQARVENGQIKLPEHVTLAENALVYVVIPDPARPTAFIGSPRLAHPEQAGDFELEVVEGPSGRPSRPSAVRKHVPAREPPFLRLNFSLHLMRASVRRSESSRAA